MNVLSTVADGVTKAIDYVVEKNRKTALINRIKIVIRNEEKKADQAYIALGKYYFRNLRDSETEQTEKYCRIIDESSKRIDRAITKLEEIRDQEKESSPKKQETYCSECARDCEACFYEDDFDDGSSLKELNLIDGVQEEEENEEVIPQAEPAETKPWVHEDESAASEEVAKEGEPGLFPKDPE